MARSPKVAIVGAGIGGLTAALALRRRGVETIVYEQSARLGEIGAGLNLSPNALKAFRALGIEPEVVAVGYQDDYQAIRSWRSGRIISRQRRSGEIAARFGASFLTIHRADLANALLRSVPADAIRLGAVCTGVEAGAASAVARFADGSAVEADVVVGADGIR